MNFLETELLLKVQAIPTKKPVPGLATVSVKITKRKMYEAVSRFRARAGVMDGVFRGPLEMSGENLLCDQSPVWFDEQGKVVTMTWFPAGAQILFVEKVGALHLMNMFQKHLVRSESFPLSKLMERFGEDGKVATLPADRLRPGEMQGRLTLMDRH